MFVLLQSSLCDAFQTQTNIEHRTNDIQHQEFLQMFGNLEPHNMGQFILYFQRELSGEGGIVDECGYLSFPVATILKAQDIEACKIGLHCLMQLLRMKSDPNRNTKAALFLWDFLLMCKVHTHGMSMGSLCANL
jgi:hypothetical protein